MLKYEADAKYKIQKKQVVYHFVFPIPINVAYAMSQQKDVGPTLI